MRYGRRVIEIILILILLLLTFYPIYNPSVVLKMWGGTALLGIVVTICLLWHLSRTSGARISEVDLPFSLTTPLFIAISISLTIIAIDTLPDLAVLYVIIHGAMTLFILIYSYLRRGSSLHGDSEMEIGIVMLLVYSSIIFHAPLFFSNGFAILHILSVILLLKWISERGFSFVRTKLNFPLLLFLIVGLISTFTSLYFYNSYITWLRLLNYIFIYFLIVNWITDRRQINLLISTMLILVGITTLLGFYRVIIIWQNLGPQPALGVRLWVANIHPNEIATYLLLIMPIVISLLLTPISLKSKIPLVILLLAMFISLVLTYSRGGWLAFLVMLATLLILKGERLIGKVLTGRRILILAGAILILILLIIFIPNPISRRLASLTKAGSLEEVDIRFVIWRSAWSMLADNLWTGVGLSNYYLANPIYWKGPTYAEITTRGFMYTAHNLFLNIGVEMGIFALALFVIILILIMSYGLSIFRKDRLSSPPRREFGNEISALLAGIVALVVQGIFHYMFWLSTLAFSFWAFAGMIASLGRMMNLGEEEIIRERRSLNYPGQILAILLVIILTAISLMPLRAAQHSAYGRRRFAYGLQNKEKDKDFVREAMAQLNLAMRLDPFIADYYQIRGDMFIAIDMITEARDTYEKAVRLNPRFPTYTANLGWLYWYLDRPEDSIAQFKGAITSDPHGIFGQHYSDLGVVYLSQGDREKALEQFAEAIKTDPALLKSELGKALLSVEEEIIEQALERVEREVDSIPSSDEGRKKRILLNLGKAYYNIGYLLKAEEILARLIEIDERDIMAHYKLGLTYKEMRRFPKAEKELKEALALGGEAKVNNDLGDLYYEIGLLDKAIEQYNIAISRWPYMYGLADMHPFLAGTNFNVDGYERLGKIYMEKNDLGRSLPQFERVLFIDPNREVAHYNIGKLFRTSGRFSEAVKPLRAAIGIVNYRLTQLSATQENWPFKLYARKNNIDLNKSRREEVSKYFKRLSAVYYELGLAYEGLKDIPQARAQLELAVQLDPENREAKDELQVLLSHND